MLQKLNIKLDKSKIIKRYVLITYKDEYKSKKYHSSHYSLGFNSWINSFLSSDLDLNISENTFKKLDRNKVLCIPTKHGFFGYDYIPHPSDMHTIDRNLFPPKTKFPLTEEEAEKLIKKAQEEKQEEN